MATKLWVGNVADHEGDWGYAANWSPSGVPASADDIWLRDSAQDVTAGLDQSAVAPAGLHLEQTWTGKITGGYLKIAAVAVDIGRFSGSGLAAGSGRIRLDLGSAAATVVVHNTGTPADLGLPAVRLLMNHASASLFVLKGKVGLACETPFETSLVAAIQQGWVSQQASDSELVVGAGVTLTDLTKTGGRCWLNCAAADVVNSAGELTTEGAGAIASLEALGGTVIPNSTGTIGSLLIDGGAVDALRSRRARTFTAVELRTGSLAYDPQVVTVTTLSVPVAVRLTASAG